MTPNLRHPLWRGLLTIAVVVAVIVVPVEYALTAALAGGALLLFLP